ncbi:MAG: hypothetical protein IK999_18880 [Ruminococcus sp.]|nr:hypothetical protein [Ruminococcus sp.]
MRIPQPRNTSIRAKQVQLRLVWAQNFSQDSTKRFGNAQKFVDSEVIRLMVKYTPSQNNMLSKEAVMGTKIGTGRIYYVSPYARYQYYGVLMVSSLTGSPWARHGEKKVLTNRALHYSTARHPEAQRLWFETTKTVHLKAIMRGAQRISGGGR